MKTKARDWPVLAPSSHTSRSVTLRSKVVLNHGFDWQKQLDSVGFCSVNKISLHVVLRGISYPPVAAGLLSGQAVLPRAPELKESLSRVRLHGGVVAEPVLQSQSALRSTACVWAFWTYRLVQVSTSGALGTLPHVEAQQRQISMNPLKYRKNCWMKKLEHLWNI